MRMPKSLTLVIVTADLQVLVVEDGKIRKYNGDFEDYRTELIKEIQAELDEE
jgi:hypothetical protein